MRLFLGFILPFIITLVPLILLINFGIRRILTQRGIGIVKAGGFSLLIGIATPIFAVITSIYSLSAIQPDRPIAECYTFVTGFIAIGLLVLPTIILLTIILKVVDSAKQKTGANTKANS